MTVIELSTEIERDINACFDLARDIDIHQLSTAQTHEKAVDGKTNGLCELGDRITWEAKHLGIRQRLSVEITKFNKPYFFEDSMTKGAFKSMRHEHHFKEINGRTTMSDKFEYEVPFGFVGQLFNQLFLKSYMKKFLITRNLLIKKVGEGQ